jgi:hypothetical protein
MPGPLSCRLFRSPKLAAATLREKLRIHRHTMKEPGLTRPLVDDVAEFKMSGARASFKFFYDYVVSIPYRDEIQKIIRTATAEVAVIDPPGESVYYVYGRADVAEGIRLRLGRALGQTDDFIEDVVIPSARLKQLVQHDAAELKYGWWDGLETYARKGALKGNLFKSKYYSDFKKANPTSITFESKSIGRTIRVSIRGSITLYGKDLKTKEIEDYVAAHALAG